MLRLIKRVRFSLRTLIVVTVLMSVVFAWAGYQIKWIRQRQEILASPRYGHGTGPFFLWDRPNAPWQLRLFGEEGYLNISVPMMGERIERFGDDNMVISIEDPGLYPEERAEMERMKELFPEASIFCVAPEFRSP